MPKEASNVTEHDVTSPDAETPTGDTRVSSPDKGPTTAPKRQPELTKVSANFVPRAMHALDLASEITGDSRTDVLNRAVQVYAYLAQMTKEGRLIFVEDPSTKAKDRVVFL
jgi:hypothetical protein